LEIDLVSKNTKYAGFWRRLITICIDGFILAPVFLILDSIPLNRVSVIFLALISSSVGLVYYVLMLGFCGQTLGMMFSNIKVKKLNLKSIGWKESFLRYSVDLGLFIVTFAMEIYYFNGAQESSFSEKDISHFIGTVMKANSNFNLVMTLSLWFSWVWTFSEVIVLLMNEKKRAIHDFIAGTVVVNLPRKQK
jgi:uncharacterized RDD family membrane protein YckC